MGKNAHVDQQTEDAPEQPRNDEGVIGMGTDRETIDDENEATILEQGPNNRAA